MQPRILVAFDFSPESERALDWAADLQRSTGGTIHVVHVVNPVPTAAVAMPIVAMVTEEQIQAIDAELREVLGQHKAAATAEVILGTDCAGVVLDIARANSFDLIVMGTHGRGALKRLALGSVADRVARHADCPVVTMRAPASHAA